MNSCNFIGRLTSDVELKSTANGISVCSFTLAVDRPNAKDSTDFINFVAWRSTAEFVTKYFKKGQRVGITGVLTSRKFTDQYNKGHVAFEVLVDRVEFCDSKKDGTQTTATYTPTALEELGDDDDLPFN